MYVLRDPLRLYYSFFTLYFLPFRKVSTDEAQAKVFSHKTLDLSLLKLTIKVIQKSNKGLT